jgi:hypothetical protein
MSDFAPKVVAILLANGRSFARHGKGGSRHLAFAGL